MWGHAACSFPCRFRRDGGAPLEPGLAHGLAFDGGLVTRDVATLKAPSYFGEMSLMTGEPRSATITAVTDAECYRLAKATFERLLQRRPELAERLATSIAERRTRLAEVVEDLSQDERQHRVEEVRWELVEQIRSFFGIREREKP